MYRRRNKLETLERKEQDCNKIFLLSERDFDRQCTTLQNIIMFKNCFFFREVFQLELNIGTLSVSCVADTSSNASLVRQGLVTGLFSALRMAPEPKSFPNSKMSWLHQQWNMGRLLPFFLANGMDLYRNEMALSELQLVKLIALARNVHAALVCHSYGKSRARTLA